VIARTPRYNERVSHGLVDSGVPTVGKARGPWQARRARNIRRIGLAGMAIVVAAALAGLLGPRESTTVVTSADTRLTVHHTQVTRPGIAAPFEVVVHRVGGFERPIELAISSDLFDRLDFQSWYPSPSAETADDDMVVYEFDPPDGETFELALDARAQPKQGPSTRRYSVVLLDDGVPELTARFRMWVMP
jgi:hypothetical protein